MEHPMSSEHNILILRESKKVKKTNLLRMKFQSLEMLRKELKQHLILRRKSPKMLRKLKKRKRTKM